MPLLIAVASVFFTNYLSNTIAENEENKIKQWTESVKQNAKLIRWSNFIAQKSMDQERLNILNSIKAKELLGTSNSKESRDFLMQLIKQNDHTSSITTDRYGKILDFENVRDTRVKIGNVLDKSAYENYFTVIPIELKSYTGQSYLYFKRTYDFEDTVQQTYKSLIYDIESIVSSLPMMLLDEKHRILAKGNLPDGIEKDPNKLNEFKEKLIAENKFFDLELDETKKYRIYYRYSFIIVQLKWFPFYLYSLMAIMALFSWIALRNTRRNEKNQIWVGMSKETAHQLGTPISSLTAWLEVFKEFENYTPAQNDMLLEMENDVKRLTLIADRFSKIGSKPKLENVNLKDLLTKSVDYLMQRASKKIEFRLHIDDPTLDVDINKPLFEWVVENIMKNSLDAMGETGLIKIVAFRRGRYVYIDFKDTGKGIEEKDFGNIFQPGFTTKKRGWGLGLSLCKRIIVEYFGGKIFVKWSKKGIGTSIRVALPQKLQKD
jgi:signal transduction histidine kinase